MDKENNNSSSTGVQMSDDATPTKVTFQPLANPFGSPLDDFDWLTENCFFKSAMSGVMGKSSFTSELLLMHILITQTLT